MKDDSDINRKKITNKIKIVECELGSLKDEKKNGTLGKNSPVKCEGTSLKIEVFLCVE